MGTVLITGAAGFIGSQLAYRLKKDGKPVVLVDNFSYGSEDNLVFPEYNFTEEIYRIDVRDVKGMEQLFAKYHFERVYHIAAITPLPDCQVSPIDAVDVNVRGTTVVLELSRKYGVKQVIFASTSAIYENNEKFPSEESFVTAPSMIYANTKLASEQFCRAYWEAYGMPVVCLRFANVYGPHIDCLRTQPPVMGYIIREFFQGNQPILHADGEQRRDFVYIDDLVDLCLAVREARSYDIINVSTESPVSIKTIARLIAKEMGCENITPIYVDTAHYWSKYSDLYKEPYPISKKLLEHEVLKYTCLSNKYAMEKYGWKPKTELQNGIAQTVRFAIEVLNRKGKSRYYG